MSQNRVKGVHSTATPELLVIVCDFNGWQCTSRCLAALARGHFQAFETIVVDHGTTDATAGGLHASFPEVHRLVASSEVWWAGATNVGIRAALQRGASRVMLLNNDCYVQEDTLATLMHHSLQYPEAIIAPVQRDLGSESYVAITPRENLVLGFATLGGPSVITEAMQKERLLPTALIGGGRGVIIPSQVFEQVGILDDENLPHYYADHDFYLRCRAASVPLRVAVDAEVLVDASQTSVANDIGKLDWPRFIDSLTNCRSHRSVRHLRPLFKKHYPVRRLHWIGVVLYTSRYLGVYFVKRLRNLVRCRSP